MPKDGWAGKAVAEGESSGDAGTVVMTVACGLAGVDVAIGVTAGDTGLEHPAVSMIPASKRTKRILIFFISTGTLRGAIYSLVHEPIPGWFLP
jgi:hypothetical protein